jgi:hypothetical protein
LIKYCVSSASDITPFIRARRSNSFRHFSAAGGGYFFGNGAGLFNRRLDAVDEVARGLIRQLIGS